VPEIWTATIVFGINLLSSVHRKQTNKQTNMSDDDFFSSSDDETQVAGTAVGQTQQQEQQGVQVITMAPVQLSQL
jgi:hypothetical protein